MGEWKTGALVDIAAVKMGQAPSGNSVNALGEGMPFLQGNAEFGTINPTEIYWCTQPRKTADIGNLLVSVRAPVGEINVADKKYCIGRGLAAIDFWGINKAFARYSFSKNIGQLHVRSQGTTFLAVSKKDINDMVLSYPLAPAEQSKIAEVLSATDEAIEKTKALIVKYRNIKTGLMQDLLSNGIDEHGKIRTPETHAFNDSPLGRIPVEWGIQPLSSLTDKIADRNHTTPDYVKHGVYIVSPKDFDENERIDFSNCAQISQQDHLINRKKTDIRPGDLIFTRIGAGLGKVCYVSDEMPEFSILHSAAMIRVNQKITATMLMYIIRSHYFQRLIEDGIQSIGVPDLGMDKINALLVKYPINKEEQQQINERLTASDEKIQTEQAYLAKLQDIKRGLMQDLLTNEVSVDALM